jgi:riboflavin biosynthesis pyrimidine reductase
VLPDTPPQPANAPDGVAALPTGPDTDDALAALYAWPEPDSWPGRAGTPVVRANMIASLDGGATVDGRSAGLGNAADTRLFTLLRDLADVILVGSGTVRAERYGGIRLDADRRARRVRWGLSAEPPPIAVVTTRGLDPQLPLFTDTETPPIVVTTHEGARAVPEGARTITAGHDRVNLADAIGGLDAAGFRHIHCEGGPGLLGSLVAADLLDECCLTIAPLLLGSGAQPMLPVAIDNPARWQLVTARVDGHHLFTRYRRARG